MSDTENTWLWHGEAAKLTPKREKFLREQKEFAAQLVAWHLRFQFYLQTGLWPPE